MEAVPWPEGRGSGTASPIGERAGAGSLELRGAAPWAVCRWTVSSRAAAWMSTGHLAARCARVVMLAARSKQRSRCRSRREQAGFLQLDKHVSSVSADEPSVRVSVVPAAPPDPVLKGKMDDIEELRAKAERSMFEQVGLSVL